MKCELSINQSMEEVFQQTLKELGLHAYCIREEIDGNRYEIAYLFPNDIYYLGIQMGLKKQLEIFTK